MKKKQLCPDCGAELSPEEIANNICLMCDQPEVPDTDSFLEEADDFFDEEIL